MADTAHLLMPLMSAAQSQKHLTHNDAILMLDTLVQLSVKSASLTAPPGSPAEGDRYIIGSSPTGAWSGKDLNVTSYLDGVWVFFPPRLGWVTYNEADNSILVWTGSAWVNIAAAGGFLTPADLSDGSVLMLGVNTSPDATNRLAAKTNAVLFSHDDVTPGTGDLRVTLNKSAAARDAAFFFQDGFSTRATFGLLADDNFTVKVSPNGSTYYTGFTVDRTNGQVTLDQNPKFQAFVNYDAYIPVNAWTKVPFNDTDHNDFAVFSGANNEFTAPAAGYYTFGAKVAYKWNASNPTGPTDPITNPIRMQFYKNGSALVRTLAIDNNGFAGQDRTLESSCHIKLAAGDKIDVRVYYNDLDGYVEANTNLFYGFRVP